MKPLQVVGGIVGVDARLAPYRLVVDVSRGVAGKGQPVQPLLGTIRCLHKVPCDSHHSRVELRREGVVGEIVKHPRCREHAEVDVSIDADDIRGAILHQPRAQIRLWACRIVDVDMNGRVLLFELGDHRLELVGGFGLALEKINRHHLRRGHATARERTDDRECAHRGHDSCKRSRKSRSHLRVRLHMRLLPSSTGHRRPGH